MKRLHIDIFKQIHLGLHLHHSCSSPSPSLLACFIFLLAMSDEYYCLQCSGMVTANPCPKCGQETGRRRRNLNLGIPPSARDKGVSSVSKGKEVAKGNSCLFCGEKLEPPVKVLACGHKCHEKCIRELKKHYNNSCSECKKPMF